MMDRKEREQLEQELWELWFGCLDDEATLRRRIDEDAEVRALWQDVEARARVVEEAARDPVAALRLHPGRRRTSSIPRRLTRTAAAAAALVALAGGYYGVQAWRLFGAESVAEVRVAAPSSVPDGAPLGFTIDVQDDAGEPRAADVSWRALTADGTVLASGAEEVVGSQRFEVRAALPGVRRVVVDAPGVPGADGLVLDVDPARAAPLVHVTTDKPVHRPGETVYARAVRLDRLTLEPIAFDKGCRTRVIDPRGVTIEERWVRAESPEHGVLPLQWQVPEDAAGGRYRLDLVSRGDDQRSIAHADVLVRRFERPRLQKELTLAKASYAPGETARAEIAVERLGGGGAAEGATADAILVVDGDEVGRQSATLDARGRATFALEVPAEVERGDARVVVRVADGGVVETAVRPFVVPTGRIELRAFPEGGDLVAGFENRVYLEATDPLGRPVEVTGRVVTDGGTTVASFADTDRGRAIVAWTPDAERRYAVVIDSPTSTRTGLPAAVSDGVLLRSLAARHPAGAPLRVRVATAVDEPLVVAAFCRNVMVGQATTAGAGERDVDIPLADSASGVLRVTVFDDRLRPRAERLVQRAPEDPLAIELSPEHRELAPRDTQRVTVTTRRASGQPVAAVIGLAVSDLSNRAYADEPEVGLLDALALFTDTEDLENRAGFFLGAAGSAERVDRLLGTRGWRRYVWRGDATPDAPERLALLAREGLAEAPQVATNEAQRDAGIVARERGVRHARQTVLAMAFLGVFALVAHLLIEACARAGRFLAPRVARASPDLGAGVGGALAAAAAGAFLVSLFAAPGFYGARALPAAIRELELFDSIADTRTGNAVFDDTWEYDGRMDLVRPEPTLWFGGARTDIPGLGLLAELQRGDGAPGADSATDAYRYADVPVLEYAHEAGTGAGRRDFTETVYWNPLLVTDEGGHAEVSFDVADQVTTWLIRADAHADGAIGQAEARFEARLPLRLEARAPVEVTDGDRLLLPVALEVTHGDAAHAELAAVARGALRLDGAPSRDVALDGGRGRALLELDVNGDGPASIEMAATALGYRDRVRRDLRVVPRGFPHRRSWAGTLEEEHTLEVAVPAGLAGPPRAMLRLYPSTLSTIREGLDGMLQEPHGCFEQTSSTNYPNVMTIAYLRATGGAAPAVEARARDLLASGYARLTGFECPSRGYEWYGADPGHTALTAYGVLQFADMAEVFEVDGDMVARTRDWLLAGREGDGTFAQDRQRFGFGGAPADTTAAYATYALLSAGHSPADLRAEVDRLAERATATADAYELAVGACALALADREEAAASARGRLVSMQAEDGGLDGATTSITSSGGDDLRVEATSFAVLAWLDDPAHAARARRAVEFLMSKRRARGTFGATQATVMALRALVAFAERAPGGPAEGRVVVLVDGRRVAAVAFTHDQPDAVDVDLGPALAGAGAHAVRLRLEGDGALPWALDLTYHADTPADDPEAPLAIHTNLARESVTEGETVACHLTVENRTSRELPMTMAIVGLPAGLEVPTGILDDLRAGGAVAAWETRGREVVLYWRGLEPESRRELTLDCVAAVPGTTTGPASRTYLYYTPDSIRWAAPLRVSVRPAR